MKVYDLRYGEYESGSEVEERVDALTAKIKRYPPEKLQRALNLAASHLAKHVADSPEDYEPSMVNAYCYVMCICLKGILNDPVYFDRAERLKPEMNMAVAKEILEDIILVLGPPPEDDPPK